MIVTDITRQIKNKEKYNIFLDGKFAFGLSMTDILYFKIEDGEEISDEKVSYIKDNLIYIKAQDTAMNYLGYKMRSGFEVRKKLSEKEFSEEIIEKVMMFLDKYNYINDKAYCISFMNERERLKPKGKYVLKMELIGKGIKESDIEDAFLECDIDEIGGAVLLLEKKIRNFSNDENIDEKERKRVFAFLQRRGYSYDIIKQAFSIVGI